MLRHFPFTEKFDLKIGTTPLADSTRLIECDEHYKHEVELKRSLLNEDHRYYFRAPDETISAQWEVLDVVLNSLSKTTPEKFVLIKNKNQWHWENQLLNETHDFIFGKTESLPLAPLDWVGRQVQEDLIILDSSLTVIAGQLCFPSGWDMDGKFGKHFLSVHAPLPSLTNAMIETAGKFIERIPNGKAFQRNNWGFRVSNQLDLSARHTDNYHKLLTKVASEINDKDAGEKVWVRVEHQTLSRLPLSGCILFTIHTYQNILSEEIKDMQRADKILSFLKTIPGPLLDYKLMSPIIKPVIEYLTHHIPIEPQQQL